MPDKPVLRAQTVQEMIDEQMLQEAEKRRHINRVLLTILVFILPITTGIVAIALTGSNLSAILQKGELYTIVATLLVILELGVSSVLRVRVPRKKPELKWILADTYLRHLNESAFNPEKDVQKNESPT